MSELMYVCVALASLNAVLATGLLAVYARNVREMRSRFTLGLAAFALLLLAYNVTELVHFAAMMPAFAGAGESVMVVEGGLQSGALVALMLTTAR